jgi:hypothetical protein
MTLVNDGHFYLDKTTYSMQPFWKNVVHYANTLGGFTLTTRSLLSIMHKDYYILIKELSLLYQPDISVKFDGAKSNELEQEKNAAIQLKDSFAEGIKPLSNDEKGEYIVNFFLDMDESNEALLQLGCNRCCTSFDRTIFSVFQTQTHCDFLFCGSRQKALM